MITSAKQTVRAGYDVAAASYTADRARAGAGGDIEQLDAFIRHLTPGSHVLDAGCGAGVLAREHVPASRLVLGDLTALPFANATVDAVVSFYAIIHVTRDEHTHVFLECFRVLRPEGRALFCLGWGDNPEDHDPESWLGVPMFWSHFDADTNLALLRDAGFIIESSTEVPDPMAHASHQFVIVARP